VRAPWVRWLILAGGTASLVWPLFHGFVPLDLRVYLAGGNAVLHGHDLYSSAVQVHGYGFTYPPFAALPMALLALLPTWLAEAVVALVFFASLTVVLQLCAPGLLRQVGQSWGSLLLVAFVFAGQPTWATLRDGQINMLLAAIVLYDLRPGGQSRWCGVLVGVCAGLKLTPAVFVVYLLAQRRWADARNAVGGFLGTVALTWAATPGNSREYWLHKLYDTERIGDSSRVSNQSLLGLLLRATSSDNVARLLWAATAVVTLAGVVYVAHRLSGQGQVILALGVVGVDGCLLSPVSWTHHWVWFVPLLCGLVRAPYWQRWPGRIGAGLIATVFALGVNKAPLEATFGTGIGAAAFGDLYVITGLVTVAALLVVVLRDRLPLLATPLDG
jgi:alpha-1,2-mannosyltransferase